ncbi:MAG TPA: twin-arginine translocation signal domain-containing protein [Pyrinomonadaceae bacterium]|nr:twin-arginine translocation signal domain-containing protein [Pyrinomonadaceae bacterium]
MKEVLSGPANPSSEDEAQSVSRRGFIGGLGAAAGAMAAAPLLGGAGSNVNAAPAPAAAGSAGPGRMNDCFAYRRDAAINSRVNVTQSGNGDLARYSDYSGIYAKGLLHDSLGIPNAAAAASLVRAFQTGKQADFNSIIVGSPGGGGNSKLNGPQGALAFDLQGVDSHSTVIPPSPSTASAQTAAEAVEHYWAGVVRDVPFADYGTNPLVGQAVADLNNMSYVSGPDNNQFPYPVTRQNIFRGRFVSGDGNVKGPYVSQFMVQPTSYGAQELDQKYRTFMPDQEFMTSVATYQNIQNGGPNEGPIIFDPTPRYVRNGRDLASYTRVDVLFQGYFTAFLLLAGLGAAPNPGNPYIGSSTQKSFGTLGGPDAAGTLCEMATRALKAAWYHKWIKDLRMRPEAYGALVHARKTNANPMPQAAADLHADVLNSAVLPIVHSEFGTYLMPQPFPEGSPTHPCYPTGHGTVGGACITAMKFFFHGGQKLRPLLQAAGRDIAEPSADGLSLNTYLGPDAPDLDLNGELNKLAWNVTIGHGVHAGIHFRSSSYWSILLGEQVALAVLKDRARSYNEPFTVSIKKFDGTTATISNR